MFLRFFERLFVVVLFLSSMGVVDALTRPSLWEGSPDQLSTYTPLPTVMAETGVYVAGTLLVLIRWRRVLSAGRRVWPLVGLTALAPLSIAWSPQAMLTVRKSAFLLASTVLAIYLGERYSTEKLARLLAQTLCLMMLLVVVLSLVAPAYVIDYTKHIGAWKGLSEHKNLFGEYMAVAVVLLLLVRFRYFPWSRYVFLVTAAVLLVLSRSSGAILCCVLVVAAIPLWRVTRFNGKRRLLVYATMAVVISLGVVFTRDSFDPLFRMLGRDSTLSGRTHLWAPVLSAIMKRPILGYGYGWFWTGLEGEGLNVRIGARWLATASDNGYLDLCLSLGVFAVSVFVYVFVHSFRMAIDYLRSESGPVRSWPITYLCFYALHNTCESSLLTTRSLGFLMFAVITTSLALNRHCAAITTQTADTQRRAVNECYTSDL